MRPSLSPEEILHRRQSLNFSVIVVFLVAFLDGLKLLQYNAYIPVTAIAVTAALCLVTFFINRAGHFTTAAIILCVAIWVTILINILVGGGLWDSSLILYPFFIVLGTLFFGRKALVFFVLSVVAALVFINFYQLAGKIPPPEFSEPGDNLYFLVIAIVASSAIVWHMVGSLESNIKSAREANRALEKAYDRTLAGWAKALEYRDRETEGHSKNVVSLTEKLARHMGVPESEMENYRRGALLHDIGKLAVPDVILFKPTALTKEEWEIIQKHPVYACEMLSEIDFLKPCMDIPCSHHERWDGSGYPKGLRGEEIPFAARLFAVVDSWEALSSRRPYRPAWETQKIKEYLSENAGILYDPEVVRHFLLILQEFESN